jgi:zinc/manganese transport system permease protein
MHILFGNVLAVDEGSLVLVCAVATVTLLALAVLYRPLVAGCFDPEFLGSVARFSGAYHLAFLGLLALNLVAGFQALGSLMAFGLMLLPALAAMFWARHLATQMLLSIGFGTASAYLGLVLSFQVDIPSGPAIVLVAGAIYALSLLVGREGSLRQRFLPAPHLAP